MMESKRLTGKVIGREAVILDLCKGKNVLRLGCADWPFAESQYLSGNLLHEKLVKVCRKIVGVDLSKEGTEFLRKKGYENLYVGDVEEIDTIGIDERFDVVVAGELLEHISNPGKFLSGVHSLMKEDSVLILTVPNAFSMKNFLRVMLGRELVHPDHVFYFSQATIDHLLGRYNFKVDKYYFYTSEPKNKIKKIIFYPIELLVKIIIPFVSDGLIFIYVKK